MTADSLIQFCASKGYSITIKHLIPNPKDPYLPEVGAGLDPFYAIFIDTYGDLAQPTCGFQVYSDTLEKALEQINTVLYEASRSKVV